MGAWEQGLGGTSPGITHRLEIDEISYDVGANTSVVRISHYARTNSGTRSGSYDANEVLDGSTKRSVANVGYSWNTGFTLLFRGDYTIGHDANGYRDVGGSAYLDYAFANGTINGAISLTRLPLAPSIAAISADQISVQSVRLGMEFNNYGHGTSAASRIYYRIQGSGSGYSQTSDQGDGAGYTYWTVTGLQPGTTYEYFTRAWNNNGDTADSGSSTFTTLPAPNTSAALLAIVGVL